MSYVLGVDLGTTYSAAAVGEGGHVEIAQLGTRQATIPSIVVLRDDGEVLVGEAAERRALSEPGRVAREFKRRLGDPTPLILGGTPYGAEALMARLLESIVRLVATQKGEPPQLVAMTHPASYGPYKLDLLQQAARQADVHPVTFLSEPVAAAVHYSSQERIDPGAVVAVYDFGGGTFDAALLRRTEGGFELLGEGEGLERLGGIDFDEAVFAHVAGAVEGGIPPGPDVSAAVARLREECARAKEILSEDTEATIPVLLPNLQTDVRITRPEFETIIRPRVRETIAALERAVRRAGLSMEDVDRVLLVGGTSRIPLIAEMVREATGRPVALDAQPKHAIALGAATMALQQAADQPSTHAETAGPAATPLASVPPPEPQRPEPELTPPGADATARTPITPPPVALEAEPPPRPVVPRPTDATPPTELAPAGRAAPPQPPAGPPPGSVGKSSRASQPPPHEPVDAGATSAQSAAAHEGGNDGRIRIALLVLGPVVVVLAAIAAFALFAGGGDGDGDDDDEMPDVGATETAEVTLTEGVAEDDETPTPTRTATATTAPTATPTRPPRDSEINNITLSGGRYIVDFSTFGFVADIESGDYHVHFFFDTVPPIEAGLPFDGPWFVYDVPNPFTGYGSGDRPTGAEQMCILVANADHTVIQDTGNCFDLP